MSLTITLDEALVSGRGIERPFNCPDPNHEDRNASASVNMVNGFWYCYACGAKGTVEGHCPDPKEALKLLESIDKPTRVMPETWLDVFDAHHPSAYWAKRFGAAIATRYRCGTHPVTGHPTYPLRAANGDVLGVVQRTDGDPKYAYPYGVPVSRTLFLSPKLRRVDVLILVEGAADVMALDLDGLPATWRVAGTYGAGVHYPQLELIANMAPKVIVAAFDGDDAGYKASLRAIEACADIAPVVSHPWATFGYKDPGEAPAGEALLTIRTTLEQDGFTHFGGA